MKVKTIVAWTVKVTVMVAAPGGLFVAAYEVWKWWKHRHNQKPQPAEALENKDDEKSESVQAEDDVDKEVSEEKVN